MKLLARFQSSAERDQAALDKFARDFAVDPAYALSWSNGIFEVAARLKITKQIIAALEDGSGTLENIRATMMDRVMHKAKYPAQSTSPTSNLIEQYELSACAGILSDLEYVKE